ncbi:MAG: non-hydrolyzing UDP-N-acetylglucosamine 2-epimerase [bacterium]
MKILSVVGARPNFIKIAPFAKAISEYNNKNSQNIKHIIVHTGQHYDDKMSDNFFNDLNIPKPNINLGIGSGTHAEQVGKTMIAFEKVLHTLSPDWVVVVGDVNASLACSITAKKERIKCCHIEAGLRSFDMEMPEEINRIVTDRLCDLLLTPDIISSQNLRIEGVDENKIKFVGNIMIDTLEANRNIAKELSYNEILKKNCVDNNSFKLEYFTKNPKYGIITMHRPSNVDNEIIFNDFVNWFVNKASKKTPLIWPIHPRTIKQAQKFNLWQKLISCKKILLLTPLAYHEMLKLNMDAQIMLTDSGGLQEECCVLGTPFLTLRKNTERPITLIKHGGAGYLVGNDISEIKEKFNSILIQKRKPNKPELWDGKTAERCLIEIINIKQ